MAIKIENNSNQSYFNISNWDTSNITDTTLQEAEKKLKISSSVKSMRDKAGYGNSHEDSNKNTMS